MCVSTPSQPNGINALERAQPLFRDRLAADAVEAVAANDVVAIEARALAAVLVRQVRMRAFQIVRPHLLGVMDHDPAEPIARLVQIARELGLTVHEHTLAARQAS